MTNLDGLYVREDLKGENIQNLPGLVKRPKITNKTEVWKSLVRDSSSAQPTEEKKEGHMCTMHLSYRYHVLSYPDLAADTSDLRSVIYAEAPIPKANRAFSMYIPLILAKFINSPS